MPRAVAVRPEARMKRPPRLLRSVTVVAAACVAAILGAAPAAAQPFVWGVRAGVYTDANAGFLGGEALTTIAPSWYFDPNLEVAFAGGRDIVTANGDFHYGFLRNRPYYVWAGAGPAFIHREANADGRDNAFGVNLIGGIGWKNVRSFKPYTQLKVTLSDRTEAVLAVGLRF